MLRHRIGLRDGTVAWDGEAPSFLGALDRMFAEARRREEEEADGLWPSDILECGIDLDGHDLAGVPVVPGIDRAILDAIEAGGRLDMGRWHGGPEGRSCGTTHCRAGWAIHLAGAAGYALERRFIDASPELAGTLIYAASRPGVPVPDFFCRDDEALADLRACAGAGA